MKYEILCFSKYKDVKNRKKFFCGFRTTAHTDPNIMLMYVKPKSEWFDVIFWKKKHICHVHTHPQSWIISMW